MIKQFQFAHPFILLAFPALLIIAMLFRRYFGKRSTLLFSNLKALQNAPTSLRAILAKYLPPVLRWLAIAAALLVLARPQRVERKQWFESTGVELVLSIDTSGSMDLLDMDPRKGQIVGKQSFNTMQGPLQFAKARKDTWNRLHVVKEVVKKFIKDRKGDRLSLVIFGKEARTLCPLTNDLTAVNSLLEQVEIGMAGQLTDLQKGIQYGLKRLLGLTIEDIIEMKRTRSTEHVLNQIKTQHGSYIFDKEIRKKLLDVKLPSAIVAAMKAKKPRSQIMIMLTDGKHTAKQGQEGREDVLAAAKEAALYNIKIYTIGLGSKDGYAYQRIRQRGQYNVVRAPADSFDEDLLKEISDITKGRFFSTSNKQGLKRIYKDINKLEPNRFKVHKWDDIKELYLWFLLPMLGLLLLELLLRETILRRTP